MELSKETGSGPKAERDGEGRNHPTTLALRTESGRKVDGAMEGESTRQKRRSKRKEDDKKTTVMNDRTEKEPPNVAIESEKSERASESIEGWPTDYGGGRKCSGGMVRPDPRERGRRGGRRDERKSDGLEGIDGQRKEEGEEREERRSAGKADGERERDIRQVGG